MHSPLNLLYQLEIYEEQKPSKVTILLEYSNS